VIEDPRLYAVVVHDGGQPETGLHKRRTKQEIQSEKLAELRTKKAVDRADAVLAKLEARAEAHTKQIAALQKCKAHALTRAERIERTILEHMQQAKLSKVDGFDVLLYTKDAPPAVIVDDAAAIPPQYIRTTEAVDKAAVKAALARGVQVPGVRLEQGTVLQRRRDR
jgi:hypothetical protein